MLKEENAGLRELMGFLERNDLSFLGAEVISKSSDALRNTIVINRGSKDGVAMNMPVITGGGFYIGKIRKVELNSSVVQLINDQYSKIAATVLNNNKSIGVVEGGFGLSLQMNFIPQNEDILVGNDVITSGLEAEIPYGLILGRVDIVEKEPYQPFQKAILSPYIDLNKIKINRIWTLYDEEMMWNSCRYNPQTGESVKTLDDLILQNHKGVFLEDYIHDWNIKNDILYYYSRVVGKGESVKILIERAARTLVTSVMS